MIEEPKSLTVRKDWKRPTKEQVDAFRDVTTSFVVDAMDGRGALNMSIRPIGDGRDLNCVAVGPAITADNGPADLLATLAAMSFMKAGDILVAGNDGHQGTAVAGDRVMGMLKNNGGVGFVTDGPMRDYLGIVDAGVPAWCTGLNPASPFGSGPGRVGLPLNIGGQTVKSGDMIIADRDGVVVVPFEQIDQVIERLQHVKSLEAKLDAEVAEGRTSFDTVTAMLNDGRTTFVE